LILDHENPIDELENRDWLEEAITRDQSARPRPANDGAVL